MYLTYCHSLRQSNLFVFLFQIMAKQPAKNLLHYFGGNSKNSKNEMDVSNDKNANKRKHDESDEKSEKDENENPQPKKYTKYPHSFNQEWFKGRPWLIFTENGDGMLCEWCKITHGETMPGGRGNNWVTTGCKRFQKRMS